MRPTKEAQDLYFRENGLDPWGYEKPFVRHRLAASLKFIRRFVAADFSGTFVEIGAFNGQFTKALAAAFPAASIVASDIVKSAWEANEPLPPSVSFQWCEMADFKMPIARRPVVMLMMECLYYVPENERRSVVSVLLRETKPDQIFVSAPLDRLSKREIRSLFGKITKSAQVSPKQGGFRNALRRFLSGPDLSGQFLYRIDKRGNKGRVVDG